MKNIKIWIFIFFAIIQSGLCEDFQDAINSKGHRSGIYLQRKGNRRGSNGIVHMFQQIKEDLAVYALFHYKHNSFAAQLTKNTLEAAIQTELSESNGANVNWESFLKEVMVSAEAALMANDLAPTEKESKTEALVVIVDENENTVTQARVGHGRISLVVKDPKLANRIRHIDDQVKKPRNQLGGQHEKRSGGSVIMRGDVEVKTLHGDIQYIVIGTENSWFLDCHNIIEYIYKSQNNLIKAAQDITYSFSTRIPSKEMNTGVIIIGMGGPKMQNQRSFKRSLSCCNNPAVNE